jgi:hypothetical protein
VNEEQVLLQGYGLGPTRVITQGYAGSHVPPRPKGSASLAAGPGGGARLLPPTPAGTAEGD